MQGLTRDEYARASEWASDSRCGAGLSLRVPSEHHRIGNTKVFMRREIHDKLEEERSRLLVRQALSIQVCVCARARACASVYVKAHALSSAEQSARAPQLAAAWVACMLANAETFTDDGAAPSVAHVCVRLHVAKPSGCVRRKRSGATLHAISCGNCGRSARRQRLKSSDRSVACWCVAGSPTCSTSEHA
jgi:hypothetical protein